MNILIMLLMLTTTLSTNKTIIPQESLVLNITGEVKIVTTKSSRITIDSKVSTNVPLHVQKAIAAQGRWEYVVVNDEQTNTTTISMVIPSEKIIYKKLELQEKVVTTLYIPETIKILQ